MKRAITILIVAFLNTVSNGAVVSGSGCAISSRYILTAAHVIKGAQNITVRFGDNNIPATLVKQNIFDDWAILKIGNNISDYVSVSDKSASLGDKVYVLGFPSSSLLGENIKYSEGTISSQTGLMGSVESFQFSAPIQPGNSGGPIFNSDGQLVGIALSTLDPGNFSKVTGGSLPQNLNFGLHLSKIRRDVEGIIGEAVMTQKNKSVGENQRATCFITAVVPDPQLARTPIESISQTPAPERTNDTKWFQKYSPRFISTVEFLNNLVNRRFVLPDGSVITPQDKKTFENIFSAMRHAEILAKNEVLFNLGSKMKYYLSYPEYEYLTDLCSKAYNKIVDEYENVCGKKSNLISETFFGVHLGAVSTSKDSHSIWFPQFTHVIEGVTYPSGYGYSMNHFQHVKSYTTTIPEKKKMYGNDRIALYLTDAFKLVGIQYQPKYQQNEDIDEAIEDVKRIFEHKYGIRFRRVPTGYRPNAKSLHTELPSGLLHYNAYMFSDEQLTIYIYPWSCEIDRSNPCPWATISYTDFYDAVNNDYEGNLKKRESNVKQSDLDAL